MVSLDAAERRRARLPQQLPQQLRRLRIGGQPLERRQREPRLSERHHRQLHRQPPVPPDGGAFETVVASWNASSKADSLLYGC